MFADLRRLAGQTLVYGAGNVLTRLVGFLLLPFLTHQLSPDEYSTYTQFYIAITLAIAVIVLGLDIALLRYYVMEKSPERRSVIFSTVFWGSLGTVGVAGALLWPQAERLTGLLLTLPAPLPGWAVPTFRIALAIVALDILSNYPLIVIRGENQPGRFVAINLTAALLQVGLALYFVIVLDRGVQGVFEGNLIASVVRLGAGLPTIASRLRLKFDSSHWREALRFGLPNVPNLFFVSLVELSDRWLLGALRGPHENGIYAAGYRLGMFLSVVAMGFRYAWQPFFLQIAHRDDAREVYARVLTYYLAIALWLFLMLTAFVEPLAKANVPVIGMIIAPEYWLGLKVFPIILLAHLFNGVHAVFVTGIYIQKRTWALPWIAGLAMMVNIGGNLLLIPRYGMWAAAWLTVVAWAMMAGLLYNYIQRHYPVRYEWGRIAILLFWAGMITALIYLGHSVRMEGVGWLASLLFPLPLLSSQFLHPGERARLRGWLGLS